MRGELSKFGHLRLPGNMSGDRSPKAEQLAGSECRAAGGMHKRRKLSGFTLTEVIIASTLLILAMVPILKALTSAIASSTIIERRTRSLALAEAKLDEIRARSIYNYGQDFTTSSLSVDGQYLCNVTDTTQTSDLRRITVSVGHDTDGDSILRNREIEVALTTLLARRW
ncbi:MAG: type IV pilus modification PilV family protein [Planctomycetota bacterium]|jgi:type II secretory pathway pseudopilin PulG